jgi:hypothetical protein
MAEPPRAPGERTTAEMFSSTRSGASLPLPYPESKLALAEGIAELLRQARDIAGRDTLAGLSLTHAASLLVAELHERMTPIRDWIPPIPEPLGALKRGNP